MIANSYIGDRRANIYLDIDQHCNNSICFNHRSRCPEFILVTYLLSLCNMHSTCYKMYDIIYIYIIFV